MSEMDLHEDPSVDDAPAAVTDPEAPEADAAEQRVAVRPEPEDPPARLGDVDPADLSDQHRTVELDEDDYR